MTLRNTVVVLAIAALLVAALVPAAPLLLIAVVTVFLAPLTVVVVRPVAVRCAEQPVALRALVSFRGPPSLR